MRDESIQDMTTFSEAAVDAIRGLSATAKQKAKFLRAEADEAARVQRVCEELFAFVGKGWPLHIVALLDKENELLKSLRAEGHAAIPALEDVYRGSKEQAESLKRRFTNNLDEACKSNSLPLDRDSSRHPRYTFENGFIHLEIDDYKGRARLSNNETRLDEFPADIGAIVEAIQREHKRLFARPFDGKKFLQKLRRHYCALTAKQGEQDGDSLPIRRITARLGKNEDKFRTDEFLVDLSRLVDQGPADVDGYRFDLQQTKDTKQGMLLHGPAGRGYVGFITFRKV
jgi:hypothetical protein